MQNEIFIEIDDKKLRRAIRKWGDLATSIKLISNVNNLIYRFEHKGQGYYLRIINVKVHSEQELQAAISYQRYLFENGASVCEPVVSNNKLWIEYISQNDNLFLAHVCREVPGKHMNFNFTDFILYKNLGKTLGQLHKLSIDYNKDKQIYPCWEKFIEKLLNYAQHESQELQICLTNLIQFMHNRSRTSLNYGLTHGDFREGNIVTDGNKIHIIDFDLIRMDWFTNDLVRPFYPAIINNDIKWQDKIVPYLDGYLSVMPKESIDLNALVKQLQMQCLKIYLLGKNNWHSNIAPIGGDTKQWLQMIYQLIIAPEKTHIFLLNLVS